MKVNSTIANTMMLSIKVSPDINLFSCPGNCFYLTFIFLQNSQASGRKKQRKLTLYQYQILDFFFFKRKYFKNQQLKQKKYMTKSSNAFPQNVSRTVDLPLSFSNA